MAKKAAVKEKYAGHKGKFPSNMEVKHHILKKLKNLKLIS